MTHNNQEELREELIAVYYKDFNDYNDIDVKFEDVYEFLHHQLQKAREEEVRLFMTTLQERANTVPPNLLLNEIVNYAHDRLKVLYRVKSEQPKI